MSKNILISLPQALIFFITIGFYSFANATALVSTSADSQAANYCYSQIGSIDLARSSFPTNCPNMSIGACYTVNNGYKCRSLEQYTTSAVTPSVTIPLAPSAPKANIQGPYCYSLVGTRELAMESYASQCPDMLRGACYILKGTPNYKCRSLEGEVEKFYTIYAPVPLTRQHLGANIMGDYCYSQVGTDEVAKKSFPIQCPTMKMGACYSVDGTNINRMKCRSAEGESALYAAKYITGERSLTANACPITRQPITGFSSAASCAGSLTSVSATFEAAGIELSLPAGQTRVRYRVNGVDGWQAGLPLWFDGRSQQHRGSIVGLKPNTEYEVQVLHNNRLYCGKTKTWSETFPVARTFKVGNVGGDKIIATGGTATGYHLYTAGTVTGGNIGIYVNAPYVIIRGLYIKDALTDGIRLGPLAHHVVIEKNTITNWGTPHPITPKYGKGWHSAIYGPKESALHHIVIQNNYINTPRSNSNAWNEVNAENGYSAGCKRVPIKCHPEGPQGIALRGKLIGHNVIRYNTITSTRDDRLYNDAMGGSDNFSEHGFPGPNSDIYGNYVSHYADDGLEIEGGGRNVRVWGNHVYAHLVEGRQIAVSGIAMSAVTQGPAYVWNNLMRRNQIGYAGIKLKSDYINGVLAGASATYFINNTITGFSRGIHTYDTLLHHLVARNNVFNTPLMSVDTTVENKLVSTNYNLIRINDRKEPNGIVGSAVLSGAAYSLAPGSLGTGAALRMPGFNDCFRGTAPDMGAAQADLPAPKYGVR